MQLEQVSLKQSEADPCLFMSEKVVCLVYIDNTLFYAQNQEDIDDIITNLKTEMELEEEDDTAGFLRVHINQREDRTIHLTQKGLINRIIKALNIGDLPPKRTPTYYSCLGKDEHGNPPDSTFNYPSIIGMFGYLHGHSRPDIMFTMSQC
jgi:hypothetical protein